MVRDDALAGVIGPLDASAHNLSMEIGLVLSPAFRRTSLRTRPGYYSGLPSHCPIPTPDADCRDSAGYGTGAADTACCKLAVPRRSEVQVMKEGCVMRCSVVMPRERRITELQCRVGIR